jgi:hypothetical protein
VLIIKILVDTADLEEITRLENVSLPISRPLVENLEVMYAFDLPDHFAFLNERDASELNLTHSKLHDLAIDNLLCRLENIDIQQMNDLPVFCLQIGGNLDASLMLLAPRGTEYCGARGARRNCCRCSLPRYFLGNW